MMNGDLSGNVIFSYVVKYSVIGEYSKKIATINFFSIFFSTKYFRTPTELLFSMVKDKSWKH